MVRAVDFAQRNGDVSGWTVGRSERRGTVVPSSSCPTAYMYSEKSIRDNVVALVLLVSVVMSFTPAQHEQSLPD